MSEPEEKPVVDVNATHKRVEPEEPTSEDVPAEPEPDPEPEPSPVQPEDSDGKGYGWGHY